MNKFATLLLLAVGSLTFAATTAQTSDTSSSDSSNLTSSGSTTDGKNTYQEPTSPDVSGGQSASMTSGKKAPSHSHHRSHHHTKKVAK